MACPGPPPPASMLCSPHLEARRIALLCLVAVVGCGGERQDENEPEGDFQVEVVSATFPEQQKLAQKSELVITVRNTGDEAVPNIAVTVSGLNYRATEPVDRAEQREEVARLEPGRAVAEGDRGDRQRQPAEPQHEQELLDELGAVGVRRPQR